MFVNEWTDKLVVQPHTTGCYSAKQGTMTCETVRISLKDIILSKRSQTQKSTCHIIQFAGDPGNINLSWKQISGSQESNCKEVKEFLGVTGM